ncbi:MAG: CoA ester lyase [Gemmatimonadetes bacterium]|nr:CoA ester lyase [Gemmatimonadota bacterium]
MSAPTRLVRSMLYVPASRPEMIAKAAQSDADAVCLDLEDAVAPDQKAASRAHAVTALTTLDFGSRTVLLRINGLDTPWAYRDIVEVVEPAGRAIDCLMLPKTRGPDDVRFVATFLDQVEAHAALPRRIGIEAQIETASGFVAIREIATATDRLESLIFGSGDYAASMRMPLASIGEPDEHDALYPGHRWHAVMHGIVAAARAAGLLAIDGPYADFTDDSGLERACRVARGLGYDGKQCIHPRQIAIVNRVFSPTEAEVAWARRVHAALEDATAAGRGAVAIDGKMIDAANYRMIEETLRRAEAIASRSGRTR